MTPPIPARLEYAVGSVPVEYVQSWVRNTLVRVQQALWQPKHRTVRASGLLVAQDDLVLVDATAAPVSITLLPAAQAQFARTTIKKIDASAHAVTLVGTIDGAVNPTLATQYKAKTIQSDGVGWYTLATV